MIKEIGLFPLNAVLFPESAIPLHIFEERYKQLINTSIDNNLEFGIIFYDENIFHEIGCTAKVIDILKKYEDGRMDIIVEGLSRFRIKKMSDAERPYRIAVTEEYNDEVDEVDAVLLKETVEIFNRISDFVELIKISKIDLTTLKTKMPSYLIAQKAGLTTQQKQELMIKRSENERLKFLQEHLSKLMPLIKETESMKKIIRNDGYFSFKNP